MRTPPPPSASGGGARLLSRPSSSHSPASSPPTPSPTPTPTPHSRVPVLLMIAAVVGGAVALSLVAGATSPHRPRAVVASTSTKPVSAQDLLPLLTKDYEPWRDTYITLEQLDLMLADARRNLTGPSGGPAAAAASSSSSSSTSLLLDPDGGFPVDQVAVVVMASAGEEGRRRARTIVQTWWRWLKPGTGRLCADADDPELGLTTLPSLVGRPTYEDAQTRQTECLKWYYERDYGKLLLGEQKTKAAAKGGEKEQAPADNNNKAPPRPAWYLLADDDTWVNIPLLRRFLAQGYDPDLPLLIGHAYDWPPDDGGGDGDAAAADGENKERKKKITLGGGAGMLLSRGAFLRMVPRMAEDDDHKKQRNAAGTDAASSSAPAPAPLPCAAAGFNDVTLPRCAGDTGVLLVHTELFDGHDRGRDAPNPSAGHMAVHRVTDRAQALRLSCDAVRRYGYGWGGSSSSSSSLPSWREECEGV